MIVEDEQQGKERAAYGKNVLKDLSGRLNEKFGKGFSEQNLRNMRQFFQIYSERAIRQTPSGELQNNNIQTSTNRQTPSGNFSSFSLSWSHYLVLMRIENPAERSFYEIEALTSKLVRSHFKAPVSFIALRAFGLKP
jgi:hypothetical protein